MVEEWKKYNNRYLGVDVMSDGRMNEEMNHIIGEAKEVSGGLQKL